MVFDLLSTVEYGGCSAKLSPTKLREILKDLPKTKHENLLVDIDTHDDAGVYKLTDDIALIQTTDFFPPICSDPYEFGQIAAANSLSDVYAMGGKPLTALNLMMFSATKIPLNVMTEILKGGHDKVTEAGALIVGGHTIDDYPPKYGLAVTGTVHPDDLISNSQAKPGDKLILTKPLGMGVIVAGQRLGEVKPEDYQKALNYMKLLNRTGAELMVKYNVKSATDITGFSLLGHSYQMAKASDVSFTFDSKAIPILNGAYDLADLGCIPGAAFRNLQYIDEFCEFSSNLDYQRKMIMLDAQTSGGLLMCASEEIADDLLTELKNEYPEAKIIGEVKPRQEQYLYID